MGYESVIFDNDGVIVSLTGMDTHYAGTRRAFRAVGVRRPRPEDVEAMSLGVTVPLLEEVCSRYDLDPDAFWRARDTALAEVQRAAMRAGRKRPYGDVRALSRLDCPLGVVSSNQQATVEFAYDHFGLGEHFETVRARPPTVESLRRKKPRPYYLERAMDDLGVTDALYVGDSESDVEAAHRAGVDAAFVRRAHTREQSLGVTPEYDVSALPEVVDIAKAR